MTSGGSYAGQARSSGGASIAARSANESKIALKRASKNPSAKRRFSPRSGANVARSPSAPANRPDEADPGQRHLPQVGVVPAAVPGQVRVAGELEPRIGELVDRRERGIELRAARGERPNHQKKSWPR